jgi:hypothetical protein
MIEVVQLFENIDFADLNEVSVAMTADTPFYEIGCVNWLNFPYKPNVKFAIAHNNREIFIKYIVEEKSLRAICTQNNNNVCQDSCCEFFVSPEGNDCFYNFETNCIGTLRLGYRKLGEKSEHASDAIINSVRRLSSLRNAPFDTKQGNFAWNMIVAIPLTSFFKHNLTSLQGKTFTANFYKCGDNLPEPHFLSHSPIKTDKPSFHQPAFFEELRFL